MFLHARQILRRRLKAAAEKAKEGGNIVAAKVDAVPAAVDAKLEQLAADEAATLERVRAHFAARRMAHLADEQAREAAAEAEALAARNDLAAADAGADSLKAAT